MKLTLYSSHPPYPKIYHIVSYRIVARQAAVPDQPEISLLVILTTLPPHPNPHNHPCIGRPQNNPYHTGKTFPRHARWREFAHALTRGGYMEVEGLGNGAGWMVEGRKGEEEGRGRGGRGEVKEGGGRGREGGEGEGGRGERELFMHPYSSIRFLKLVLVIVVLLTRGEMCSRMGFITWRWLHWWCSWK